MIFGRIRTLASISLAIITIIIFCALNTNGLKLNSNGGYDILLAVEEDTPSPLNPVIYFNKIQLIMQTLSNAMWVITDYKFFVNSIQLLVPESWNLLYFPATTQSYENADIRISDRFQYLRAENPNTCGLPGDFVETPLAFFEDASFNGFYGTPWKALITQWARFRWGIWEEHGYPGDSKYPYFHRQPGKTEWLTTGCSDVELKGEYLTLDNKTCDVSNSDVHPGDDCRFVPDWENSNARSSLMHFHWIEQVDLFCNETTHNPTAPNRQNRNCGHRSAWEVIRETSDYKSVTDPKPREIPRLEVTILKPSQHPRLLLLLDRGNTSISQSLLQNAIGTKIGHLFNPGTIYKPTVAKLASFPSANSQDPTLIRNTEVEWTYAENNLPFLVALNDTIPIGSNTRDFSLPIQESINELIQYNNPPGSILIIIKTGSTPTTHQNMAYEHEILGALRQNPRIKVYTIEFLEDRTTVPNLESLSIASGGKHVTIMNTEDIENKLEPLLQEVTKLCITIQPPQPVRADFRDIYKGFVFPNEVNEIPILTPQLEDIEIYLTIGSKIAPEQVYIRPLTGLNYKSVGARTLDLIVKSGPEWNEKTEKNNRRFTYSIKANTRDFPNINSNWILHYECEQTEGTSCDGVVHAYGTIRNQTEENEKQGHLSLREEDPTEGIRISISTSTKQVDLATFNPFTNSPLTIFASVHKDGQPVVDLEVVATIQKVNGETSGSGRVWTISLSDDGLGTPDVSQNDGIYSGNFIPNEDGYFKISAFVKNRLCTSSSTSIEGKEHSLTRARTIKPRLLLPDQKNIGCFPSSRNQEGANSACTGLKIDGIFGRTVDASHLVQVFNSDGFKPGQPFRTLDLEASSDDNTGMISFTFTVPTLLGKEADEKGTSYSIFHSTNISDLVGKVKLAQRLGNYPVTNPPGSLELIRDYASNYELSYYVIETNYNDMRSGPSNIIALKINPRTTISTSTSTPSTTAASISTSTVSSSTGGGEHPEPEDPTTTSTSISTGLPSVPTPSTTKTTESSSINQTSTDPGIPITPSSTLKSTSTKPTSSFTEIPAKKSSYWNEPKIIIGLIAGGSALFVALIVITFQLMPVKKGAQSSSCAKSTDVMDTHLFPRSHASPSII